jgi:perosamine synthetase
MITSSDSHSTVDLGPHYAILPSGDAALQERYIDATGASASRRASPTTPGRTTTSSRSRSSAPSSASRSTPRSSRSDDARLHPVRQAGDRRGRHRSGRRGAPQRLVDDRTGGRAFRARVRGLVGAQHAVAVTNGTAALHLAMLAAGVGPGDEVIVPTMTFAASANAARYVGADVVFCDVRADTLSIDVEHGASLVTPRTKAIVVVDYAGIPCDLDEVMRLAEQHGLVVIEDACHAVGATYRGRPSAASPTSRPSASTPSSTSRPARAGWSRPMTRIWTAVCDVCATMASTPTSASARRPARGSTTLVELGYNFRLSDINAALGASQVTKVPGWVERRRELAAQYRELLRDLPLTMLVEPDHVRASWHLFPILLDVETGAPARSEVFAHLRAAGIGVNVHYRPLHLHTTFQQAAGGLRFPVAEAAYERLLSLPMWHGLLDEEQGRVVSETRSCAAARSRCP